MSSEKSGTASDETKVLDRLNIFNGGLTPLYYSLVIAVVTIISFSRFLLIPDIVVNWDAVIYIDGSYRMYLGQMIHNDFSSPLGLLNVVPGALGMKILGPNLLGLNLGISLFSLFLTLVLTKLSLKVLNRFSALLFSISVSLFFATPKTLSNTDYFSYTGAYNSVAYGILSFICVILLGFHLLPENKKMNLAFEVNITIGSAISILTLIKFPFAFISLIAITLHIYFFTGKRIVLLRDVILGFGITFSAFLLFFEISLKSMWRDFRIVISSRQDFAGETLLQIEKYFTNTSKVAFILALMCFLVLVFVHGNVLRVYVPFCLAFLMDLFSQVTIQQPPEVILPLMLTIPLLGRQMSLQNKSSNSRLIVSLTLMFPIFLLTYNNGYDYLTTALVKVVTAGTPIVLAEERIKSDDPNDEIFELALRKEINASTRIISVGCNDLYSINYGLRHARNTPLYWHNGVTFSESTLQTQSYFRPVAIFAEVDLVGVSYSCPHGDSARLFEEFYSAYLNDHFTHIKKTEGYTIWSKS